MNVILYLLEVGDIGLKSLDLILPCKGDFGEFNIISREDSLDE